MDIISGSMILGKIVFGAGVGLTRAFVGYMKNSSEEDFDAVKFVQTGFIGAIVGGGIYSSGLEVDEITFGSMIFTGTIVVDEVIKFFVMRHTIKEE